MRSDRFDWHADEITRATPVTPSYRNTQNVRRFLRSQCGPAFRLDRSFMQWIKNGAPKTMGEVADEWRLRYLDRVAAQREAEASAHQQ